MVTVEATGVVPVGRISPYCLGLWNDVQQEAHARVVCAIQAGGAAAAIQLAHAGRKASVDGEWRGGGPLGPGELSADGAEGWQVLAPSAVAFEGLNMPRSLSIDEVNALPHVFAAAARRSIEAGYDAIQIHGAHGYLVHQFLSPVSNEREDEYGGSFENRIRLVRQIVRAVRGEVGEDVPLFVRLSATDWAEDLVGVDAASAGDAFDEATSWTLAQTIRLVQLLGEDGVDGVDVSSGGNALVRIPNERDYQVKLAQAIARETRLVVSGVGRIDDPSWASELVDGGLDAVHVGRACLFDPAWANRALRATGHEPHTAIQYHRGVWS